MIKTVLFNWPESQPCLDCKHSVPLTDDYSREDIILPACICMNSKRKLDTRNKNGELKCLESFNDNEDNLLLNNYDFKAELENLKLE